MKCPFNALAVTLTVLALMLGSWAQGFAQPKPRVGELVAVEICGEGGRSEILIDSRGRPVHPDDCARSLCPDCIPVLSLAGTGTDQPTAAVYSIPVLLIPHTLPVPVGRPYAVPFGRGPPELA
jgi:hypothetical protein